MQTRPCGTAPDRARCQIRAVSSTMRNCRNTSALKAFPIRPRPHAQAHAARTPPMCLRHIRILARLRPRLVQICPNAGEVRPRLANDARRWPELDQVWSAFVRIGPTARRCWHMPPRRIWPKFGPAPPLQPAVEPGVPQMDLPLPRPPMPVSILLPVAPFPYSRIGRREVLVRACGDVYWGRAPNLACRHGLEVRCRSFGKLRCVSEAA